MRAGGGKSKGSAHERQCCKELSLWITDGKMEDCLWRSAISGGRATVARRKGKMVRQGGDICAVSPEGHIFTDRWFVECKHVRNLELGKFLVKGTGDLATFWHKAGDEARRDAKEPMIIAKQNGWPVLVITRPNMLAPWRLAPTIRHGMCDFYFYKDMLETKFVDHLDYVVERYRVPVSGGVTIKP